MNALMPISQGEARLPQAYEAAKLALANCVSIDECKDWADKAQALASYAKQADDDDLMKKAQRVKANAIRRMGELLRQFDAQGKRTDKLTDADDGKLSQREAADRAGISERQQLTAVRVANVPASDFDRQVESDTPPTVTALAAQGIKPRPLIDLQGRDPKDFNAALHFKALFNRYLSDISIYDLSDILPRLIEPERTEIRRAITAIDAIQDAIITRI